MFLLIFATVLSYNNCEHKLEATFADYAGVEVPESVQGRSLRPVLEGATTSDWPQDFYYHFMVHEGWNHYGIRTQHYKLAHYSGIDAREFIDIKKNPLEFENRYHEPQYKDVIAGLKDRLQEMRVELEISTEIENDVYTGMDPASFKVFNEILKEAGIDLILKECLEMVNMDGTRIVQLF